MSQLIVEYNPKFSVDYIDQLEQENYELSKELLKYAFHNYLADIETEKMKKKTSYFIAITSAMFILSILLLCFI